MGNKLDSREFDRRKENFYRKRVVFMRQSPTTRDQQIENWYTIFNQKIRPEDYNVLKNLQEMIGVITSKDVILQIGFQIGDLTGQSNPLLFAENLQSAVRGKEFLANTFEKINYSNALKSEKPNADTSENLKRNEYSN